jgi:hypothetical protein
LKKVGSEILTGPVLEDITRRVYCISEICANALDNDLSVEERRGIFEEITAKYADLT